MIQTHVEASTGKRYVTGDTIYELMDFIIPLMREQSLEFYQSAILRDLKATGTTLVDRRAVGLLTRLYLRETS